MTILRQITLGEIPMSPEQKIKILELILKVVTNYHYLTYKQNEYLGKCIPESAQLALKILFPQGV